MIIEHRFMKSWRVGLLASLLFLGCTSPNPRSCLDGNCTDPAYPYCDSDGSLAGEEKTCIAVACTPGEVAQCQGNNALTCNEDGGDYDLVQCDLGCDVAIGGCRLCEPNQTACTNGQVATCDSNGNLVSAVECPLGCFEDAPRCRDVDPSNGVAMYFDVVANPPDLNFVDAVLDTGTGKVTDGTTVVTVPNFTLFAPAGGVPMRVYVARNVTIKNLRVYADPVAQGKPAFILLASGLVRITGTLEVDTVGSVIAASTCVGGPGEVNDSNQGFLYLTGGGGGGNATTGAAGGTINNAHSGGVAGQAGGTESLVPLRGGCASGGFRSLSEPLSSQELGALGGGAVQISSRVGVELDGAIKAVGSPGEGDRYLQTNGFFFFGGGGGGSILIEAPTVALGPTAILDTRGGNGGSLCTTPSSSCSIAGLGATASSPATSGAPLTTSGNLQQSGSGGGGLGRIRINTPTRTYTKANTSVEQGVVTTGELVTR